MRSDVTLTSSCRLDDYVTDYGDGEAGSDFGGKTGKYHNYTSNRTKIKTKLLRVVLRSVISIQL